MTKIITIGLDLAKRVFQVHGVDATGAVGLRKRLRREDVLVSIVAGDITFSDPEFHKRETSLLGSRNATGEDFETVMAAMRSGQIPTDALNTHRMTLADVPARFPSLLDPAAGVVKAIVEV